jgi:hypothetical protein
MAGQYLPKKPKFTFCYSVLERKIFLTSKQGLMHVQMREVLELEQFQETSYLGLTN